MQSKNYFFGSKRCLLPETCVANEAYVSLGDMASARLRGAPLFAQLIGAVLVTGQAKGVPGAETTQHDGEQCAPLRVCALPERGKKHHRRTKEQEPQKGRHNSHAPPGPDLYLASAGRKADFVTRVAV